jgi:selenide,water dikinase
VRRLVLVGGGHAHVHVLADLAARPPADVAVTLVSPGPRHHYSGMVPGYLQGTYAEDELTLDLAGLCARAGARLVEGLATGLDLAERAVLVGATRLAFDRLSLDIGSEPAGLERPGVREHAVPVRPIRRAVELRARADALAARGGADEVRVAVVGAGAGGVEVALALDRRLRLRGARPAVTLVEAAPTVLPGYARAVRRRAATILARRGVAVRTGAPVEAVEPAAVRLGGGARLPSALTVWLAGAAAPALLGTAALPRDPRGFLLVGRTLQAVDGSPVWGAGDCVTLARHPEVPRAGVYAVREGPVLARSLRAALGEGDPRPYTPQRTFLSLLNTADGKALLRWHALVSHSRWAWWLKDRIDRRFVARYRGAGR